MRKLVITIVIISVFSQIVAQPLQYFMQRSSTNIASISEVQSLQVLLSGSHSFVGFEGAPRNTLLNIASPIMEKQSSGRHSQPPGVAWNPITSSGKSARNFVGATISHESYGVHSIFQATAGYNYRMFVGDNANITFGIGGGIKNISSDYAKWEPEASVYSKKETLFSKQFGARFEIERLSVATFNNDNDYFGEIVWGRLWDGTSDISAFDNWLGKEKTWHGQLSVMGRYNSETKSGVVRISANAVYKDGLGVGISYQTDRDLSVNVSLRFSKQLRVGYAYQLMCFNPMVKKHETIVRYKLGQKFDNKK